MNPPGGKPSKEKIQELVGKLATDEKFRERLFTNPQDAGREMGLTFSDRQLEVFAQLKPEILAKIGGKGGTDPQPQLLVLIPIADVAIVAMFY
jgi:hypothetical protein